MTRKIAYREACARADAARNQLLASATIAKDRVTPARLKQDAVDKAWGAIKDSAANAVNAAQQRPVAIGAALAGFALYLARRPLAALFGRLYVRISNTPPDLSETDDG
ncbi:MAG: hypothetical protein I8H86_07460 [Sphingomonadaceae bacterium]|nr:hypothetical protein [Sphingomonadaceae bacterium]MBH1998552.1 hypothetical protein [Sphingomonadaceae bacterium]